MVRLMCVSDRRTVPAHLPLAWTHSTQEEVQVFVARLDTLAQAARPESQSSGSQHSSRPN